MSRASRGGHLLWVAAVAALLSCVMSAPARAAGARPAPAASTVVREVLSHPGHVSRWSFVESPTVARVAPRGSARAIMRLSLSTQDRTAELVFDQVRERVDGRWWVQVRLPSRPAGRVGWVPESALGAFQTVDTYLVVSTEAERATLYRNGSVIFSARVGTGKASTPTPHGQFYIRDELTGFPPDGMYGPVAFGTSALSNVETDWPGGGVIGIHGTDQPWLIPGHPSHGCIRMRNRDVLALAKLLPVGTPLTIR